jgi:hypothetical protein
MKRQRRATRVITHLPDNTYVDRTVIAIIGGGRPMSIVKEVIHGRYELVMICIDEETAKQLGVPRHDKIYINPETFSLSYLKRIR